MLKANVDHNKQRIKVSCNIDGGIDQIEIRIKSDRNNNITKLSDVSDRANDQNKNMKRPDKEIWFPVVDIEITDKMEAVFCIDHAIDRKYTMNGNFYSDLIELKEINFIPSSRLEYWENAFYIDSVKPKIKDFYLQQKLSVTGDKFDFTFKPLTGSWSGEVSIFILTGDHKQLIDSVTIKTKKESTPFAGVDGMSRDSLISTLKRVIDYILNCQNKCPGSPTYQGLFLFYDLNESIYRRSDWIWTWGPAINLLLRASEIKEMQKAYGQDFLLEKAKEIGTTSLNFVIRDQTNPAYGLPVCRHDPELILKGGFEKYASPADSLFLCGWGWIPLYRKTGDKRFLTAAKLLVESVDRILGLDELVEQDYLLKLEKWKDWTMDESGFGMEGLAEFYSIKKGDKYRRIGKKYIDKLLKFFQREDGLWERTYHHHSPDRESFGFNGKVKCGDYYKNPANCNTRGAAWAMEGLISAYTMLKEEKYLDYAEKMADHLLKWQQQDGFWYFLFDKSGKDKAISEKGTAVWSHLFYRLYDITENENHLLAARKALKWLIKKQYNGVDNRATGGIVGSSPHSGVVYRQWFPMITTYTMDFFGISILEELSLSDKR